MAGQNDASKILTLLIYSNANAPAERYDISHKLKM